MLNKIDKNYFVNNILNRKIDIIKDGEIKSITSDNVIEFTVKDKLLYSLGNGNLYSFPQKRINDFLFKFIPFNNASTAFKKDFCYFDFFKPHIGNSLFLRLDIKSFFHSINIDKLKDVLNKYVEDDFIDEKKNQKIIDSVINIISLDITLNSKNKYYINKKIIPIGFSSSPLISDLYFRRIDILIQKICLKNSITYTRYADDLLFSAAHENNYVRKNWIGFTEEIRKLLYYFNFNLNDKKTIQKKGLLSLNGYVIETRLSTGNNKLIFSELRFSNEKLSKLIRAIYHLEVLGTSPTVIMISIFKEKIKDLKFKYHITPAFAARHYRYSLLNKLRGYRSFIISILKYNIKHNILNKKTKEKYKLLTEKLEREILKL
ncbi:TPA: reverse transcriptase domain-containing protein [Yersinia enterocolitica]|uniref:reverse transcriptase domain-containing protein n=1 Tax=Yersinia enterocolitica TaxID=630 RepID=UPI000D97F8DD|nr:reverse transcriptase domain-containing protein [Yersinia enterocolitica]SQA39485.1 Retron-type reverse transcriptase [Yersinia enterocolitica]SUP66365.1 Retron-type reverse transcriptase [Yersinia enterocolitica]SUQ39306.1 Retron-type reverse transcriptase [Yersinia enterocolitica]HDL8567494.1 hypothetical protein [Yersinia enterocolitica]HDM8272328.1 hypothetical protein [Yersinia enterocolitica]